MQYGYGRVSTITQDTALQEDAFRRAGVGCVVTEKWSSVGQRPALMKLVRELRPGDEVVVYKLDRLGRSLQDLLLILDTIHAKGSGFRSLTEPIDTSNPAGKLMFSLLGAVAEFERSLIKQRCRAGIAAARDRGVRFGRLRSMHPDDETDLVRLWETGLVTLDQLATMYGVHPSTAKRAVYRVHKPGHSSLK